MSRYTTKNQQTKKKMNQTALEKKMQKLTRNTEDCRRISEQMREDVNIEEGVGEGEGKKFLRGNECVIESSLRII